MSELRWILLGIGAILLVLIYLFSRRSSADAESATERRFEPTLTSETEFDRLEADVTEDVANEVPEELVEEEPIRASGRFETHEEAAAVSHAKASETSEPVAPPREIPSHDSTAEPVMPEKVIALHLLPKSGAAFDGVEFIGAIQAEGLKFGRFDIFHRFTDPDEATESTPSQFSLANMIKPGTFSLHNLDQQEFKGASLFLVLPGPEDAVAAFADMVATGRRLAATLQGQLLDAQGTILSRQSASHLREDIINYQHRPATVPAE